MRLAILSDIHEDYPSLQLIVAKAEARGYDKLICLGDISGYSLPYYHYGDSKNASACLALIREKCDIVLAGNHDLHASGRLPELPEELKGQEAWPHEQDMPSGYSQDDISYLQTLTSHEVLQAPEMNILFSHYAYPNISGFISGFYTRDGEYRKHFAFMKDLDCSLGFIGHTHIRGILKIEPHGSTQYRYRKLKLASLPVVIGVPPVTRNNRRSGFCIFDTHSRRLQVLR